MPFIVADDALLTHLCDEADGIRLVDLVAILLR